MEKTWLLGYLGSVLNEVESWVVRECGEERVVQFWRAGVRSQRECRRDLTDRQAALGGSGVQRSTCWASGFGLGSVGTGV